MANKSIKCFSIGRNFRGRCCVTRGDTRISFIPRVATKPLYAPSKCIYPFNTYGGAMLNKFMRRSPNIVLPLCECVCLVWVYPSGGLFVFSGFYCARARMRSVWVASDCASKSTCLGRPTHVYVVPTIFRVQYAIKCNKQRYATHAATILPFKLRQVVWQTKVLIRSTDRPTDHTSSSPFSVWALSVWCVRTPHVGDTKTKHTFVYGLIYIYRSVANVSALGTTHQPPSTTIQSLCMTISLHRNERKWIECLFCLPNDGKSNPFRINVLQVGAYAKDGCNQLEEEEHWTERPQWIEFLLSVESR